MSYSNNSTERLEKLFVHTVIWQKESKDYALVEALEMCSTIKEILAEIDKQLSTDKSGFEAHYAIKFYQELKLANFQAYLVELTSFASITEAPRDSSLPRLAVLYHINSGWYMADPIEGLKKQTVNGTASIPLDQFYCDSRATYFKLYDPLMGYSPTNIHRNEQIMNQKWREISPVCIYKGKPHSLDVLVH